MSEPTEAQRKEFWKWCGWYKTDYPDTMPYRYGEPGSTVCSSKLPPIDLNNLFKYAVPKLQDKGYQVELTAYEHKGYKVEARSLFKTQYIVVKDEAPALALFWALWQVKKKIDGS